MRINVARVVTAACVLGLAGGAATFAAELPVIGGVRAVAAVNGEPIPLKDLEREIEALHAARVGAARPTGRQNPAVVLDRMITARLVTQEARRTGLDELPEAKREIASFRLETARDLITRKALANVAADPAVVEKIYRDIVREYRVRSILIPGAQDAEELQAKLAAGGDFDALATALVKANKAQEGDAREWLKPSEMQPQVLAAVLKLKTGQVGPPVRIGSAVAVFKLLETRHPENAEARAQAKELALDEKRNATLERYVAGLRAKRATVDQKLLATLDFEKPGAFESLAKDTRTVARIRGGTPVTVADLAAGMNQRFFHGVEKAIEAKRVNRAKSSVLDDVLNRRVIAAEAAQTGLDKSAELEDVVARKTSAYLFGAFVQKAIVPDVKIETADLEAYRKEHAAEFSSPEMFEVEALAFRERKSAEDTLAKLKSGAEFAWLKTNAPGQADSATPNLLHFAPGLVVRDSLPEGVAKSLAGARDGDFRFHGDQGGTYYVLRVTRHEPAKPLPLDAVAETIKKRVYEDKLGRLVDDWGAKLRKASDVKIYATGDELLKLVMRDLSAGS